MLECDEQIRCMADFTGIIKSSGLIPTENRRKVLELFYEKKEVLSQQEIESEVADMNRITLYRTLKNFVAKGLIHKIMDGTNHPKYAICQKPDFESNHAHFHCTACEKTMCLNQVAVPTLPNIPKGYQVEKTNLVILGICEACT